MSVMLRISKEEFARFKAEVAPLWGWPVDFSTNWNREIFHHNVWGYSKEEDRRPIRGRFLIVDLVADAYLEERSLGGRFFIDDQLAYYKLEGHSDTCFPIALFDLVDEEP